MNAHVSRRGRWGTTMTRIGMVGATVTLTLTGFGIASASAATSQAPAASVESVSENTLAGEWQVRGTAGSNPVAPVFTFHKDHTFIMIPETHDFIAHGTWKQKRNGDFTFHIEHFIFDPAGNPVGEIKGDQAGSQCGDEFSSTGTSFRYDLNGNLLETFTVTITGERIG